MKILDHIELQAKIKRLAYQILEQYIDQKCLYFVGINNNGTLLRDKLLEALNKIDPHFYTHTTRLKINPADPLAAQITIDIDLEKLRDENILIVDDVANTGRTMFYGATIFKDVLVKSIRTCVLVDRQHKFFPIHIDFVGLSLATTINDDIKVNLSVKNAWFAQII